MSKNKFIILILAVLLAFPVISYAEDYQGMFEPINEEILETTQEVNTEKAEPKEEIQLPELPKKQVTAKNNYKQPIRKRTIAKKFLLAMLGVAFSSFVIYFGLTVYNRIRYGITEQNTQYTNQEEKPLDTPLGITEAIRSFIEKTNW